MERGRQSRWIKIRGSDRAWPSGRPSLNILAIETSSEYCSVALCAGDAVHSESIRAGQSHSEKVLGMVATVLAAGGLRLAECDAVAFGAGPGSFTGLRIACAVAQGLAWGQDLPVLPVGTLTAMAEQCRAEQPLAVPEGASILCMQDARMGEVYWSVLEWHHTGWRERLPAALSRPGELLAMELPEIALGCGNAFGLFASELLPQVAAVAGPLYPEARYVALLGRRQYARGERLAARRARPLYVRDQVALTTAERAAVRDLAS